MLSISTTLFQQELELKSLIKFIIHKLRNYKCFYIGNINRDIVHSEVLIIDAITRKFDANGVGLNYKNKLSQNKTK
jgi:hypothetical protein